MGMNLTVYVGPYLHVQSTNEVDDYIADQWSHLVRDAMMENNDDTDRSIWILGDCAGLLDRVCEFERTGDTPAETELPLMQMGQEKKKFDDAVEEVVKDIKRLDANANTDIKWGVVCCWG